MLNIEQRDHTLWAAINRPESRNALNFALMDALENTIDRLESDASIRTFVLSGTDGHFISGGDLREFHTIKTAEEAKPMAKRMLSLFKRIEQLPCWTIACINGAAYGGGWETMLAFDFRIASEDAVIGFTQGKFYLPPGWGGLTRLVEIVGRSTALKWLAETAVIEADTALSHKLINRVSIENELIDNTWQWAEELSHNDRDFIKTLKEGALRITEARWKAIHEELDSFSKFWEDKRHHQRVEKFLNRNRD
ncbi:enoyl-CoA hydratase/isomerase family protein [Balneolaceae bacterium YR4-1]|uniref:Enoyl-CoA hydratase/isomerase family protein n=1 Tax=Halalkalibaculum roseum TaxID=2709311 RepID=A0A6M1T6P6_9BACT|nr:enoyl-CoA hydratase/isomerase family protein [Halalkalibaculum roseum]